MTTTVIIGLRARGCVYLKLLFQQFPFMISGCKLKKCHQISIIAPSNTYLNFLFTHQIPEKHF